MGLRGPQPTPTPILKIRGSWRADEREAEPVADVSSPPRPDFLAAAARDEWDRLVPLLLERRTLSTADLGMLAGYCQAWGEFTAAAKRVNALDKGKKYKGQLIDHPRVVLSRAFERMTKAAARFGLSPADKTRLVADPKPKQVEGKGRFFGNAG